MSKIQQYYPNMLKTFEQCPKKFYFRYIKNISMPVNEEMFEFGKNIHALASYYLKGENTEKLEKALNIKESETWNYLKTSKYFGYNFLESEYTLSVNIKGHFFGGRLDAIVKNEDDYYILDYKTGGAPKNSKYDYQTMIYILAVSSFFNTENVFFVYLDLKNKEESVIRFLPDMKHEYEKILTETVKKIETYHFSTKNSNCKCEYSKICY